MGQHAYALGAAPPPPADVVGRAHILVSTANDLLDEGGLEGLTIRSVLARSGLGRRAFYDQFGSKDDLVLAVFRQRLSFAADHFRSRADEMQDPVEALRAIVFGLVLGQQGSAGSGSGRRGVALSREHLRLAESHPRELQAALRPLLEVMSRQIALGVACGRLRPCDTALQASLVYNFVAATVHVELVAHSGAMPGGSKRDELAAAVWEFSRQAIIAGH